MRDRTTADDIAQGAYNRALLDLILPPIRVAAKDVGYAIAVHGSLNRDIDLIAVPWTETADDEDQLVKAVTGAARGVVGRLHKKEGWTLKPHGRKAVPLIGWCGECTVHVDLSVCPRLMPIDTQKE